jgi:hypothetical protein
MYGKKTSGAQLRGFFHPAPTAGAALRKRVLRNRRPPTPSALPPPRHILPEPLVDSIDVRPPDRPYER